MDVPRQIQVKTLQDDKSRCQIERLAWQSRNQLERAKASLS